MTADTRPSALQGQERSSVTAVDSACALAGATGWLARQRITIDVEIL